jgi:photosystem II stability/assembly factor-like uncharacterized protein
MKIRILFVFLILTIGTATAQTGWRRLIDAPTYGFAANPKNPRTIVVGGFGRTIYRSDDAGTTWQIDSIDFRGGTSRLSNIVFHEKDTNIVLAGGIFGSIVRSTDRGITWETVFDPEKPRFQMSGEALISHPNNPNIIFTADNISNRIFKSYDGGNTWDTISTVNLPSQRHLCAIAIRPDSANIMLAGATSGLILKSIDSGRTWRQTTQLRGFTDTEIPRFVFSRSNPMVGYTIAAYFFYKNRPNGGVFKTIDGGETWNSIGFQDTSFWSVAVRQFEGKDEVYVGGFTDDLADSIQYIIYGPGIVSRSQDGGSSWTAIDKNIPWLPPTSQDLALRNVWMMKFIGDLPQTEKLYMATDAGFFVWDNTTSISEPQVGNVVSSIYTERRQLVVKTNESVTSVALFTLQGKRVFSSAIPFSLEESEFRCTLPETLSAGVYYCMITTSHTIINRAILVE